MAINGMIKRLCKEGDVGYVDLWDSFVGKEDMYVRDGLHLSGTRQQFLPMDCQGLGKVRYLKGHCIEFKYYADGINSGLTPPGNNS